MSTSDCKYTKQILSEERLDITLTEHLQYCNNCQFALQVKNTLSNVAPLKNESTNALHIWIDYQLKKETTKQAKIFKPISIFQVVVSIIIAIFIWPSLERYSTLSFDVITPVLILDIFVIIISTIILLFISHIKLLLTLKG